MAFVLDQGREGGFLSWLTKSNPLPISEHSLCSTLALYYAFPPRKF